MLRGEVRRVWEVVQGPAGGSARVLARPVVWVTVRRAVSWCPCLPVTAVGIPSLEPLLPIASASWRCAIGARVAVRLAPLPDPMR